MYYNGTVVVYENFDYALWGQTHAVHGSASQVGSIPATNQAAYTDGYNYGLTVMRQNINKVQV